MLEAASVECPENWKAPECVSAFLSWRNTLWDGHPVVIWDRSFLLPTPALEENGEIVSSHIYAGRSGVGFKAKPRFGKSRAISYMVDRIRESFPKTAIIAAEAYFSTHPTDAGFYGSMLDAARFVLRKGRTATDRRKQVQDLYLTRAKGGDNRRLIVFVDEAQNWSEYEWTWLKAIQNHLTENGIAMVVVSFSQEQISERRDALILSGRTDLTDRFLRRIHKFRGVQTLEDFQMIFALFDTTRFPLPNGPSFSEFFFPEAFRAGWRFKNESELAHKAFSGSASSIEIGMEWVALAVKHFLTEFSEDDSPGFTGNEERWREAIAASDWGGDGHG